MSEGGGLGKAMVFLVLAGVGGGGYYFYKNWPITFEGHGYEVKMPNGWKAEPFGAGGMKAEGVFKKNEAPGKAFLALHEHGNVIFPDMALEKFPAVPTEKELIEQGVYKAVLVGYTDGDWKYRGIAVDRTDVFVIYVIGCPTSMFSENRAAIEKSVRSLVCTR